MPHRDYHLKRKWFIQRIAEEDEKITHLVNTVELTWKTPSILAKISGGYKLTEKELNLIKAFGIEVFDDEEQKLEFHAPGILNRLYDDK